MTDIERLKFALNCEFSKRNIHKKGEMASFLGYGTTYFSGVINGKEKISDSFLDKIKSFFGINPDWIKTGEGNMLESDKTTNNFELNFGGDNSINGNSGEISIGNQSAEIKALKERIKELENDKKNLQDMVNFLMKSK